MTPAGEYWKLLDRRSEPKQKRSSHVKVRTGCVTCKARRVKCDERKPLCHRCERADVRCEGYPKPSVRNRASPPVSQESHEQPQGLAHLQPKLLQRRIILDTEAAATSPWLSASLSPVVLSGQDVSYLDAFRYHVVEDFNSWLSPGFWNIIVMRESMEDEAIRHSILGLAAMTRVGRFTKEESDKVVNNPNAAIDYSHITMLASEHHQAALAHYARAISSCRQTLASGSPEAKGTLLKRLLISTIIFIIIEMMQGNVTAAVNLVNNGLQLIQEAASESESASTDPELLMTETIFNRFSIIGGLDPCFLLKKKTNIIVPRPCHVEIPSASASPDTVVDEWNRTVRPLHSFMLKSAFGHHITAEDTQDFSANVPFRATDLARWQALVDNHLKKTKDPKTRRSLILTKVQVLVIKIHLTYCKNMTPLAYDGHVDDFREVVALADKFSDSELTGRMRFTVDFNLFPWLGFTISRCRDRSVKKYALDTFIRLVFRQGGWGNLGIIKALRAVVNIDDRWVTEDGRTLGYSWALSHWDFERRKIWVRFDPLENSNGEGSGALLLMREVAIDY